MRIRQVEKKDTEEILNISSIVFKDDRQQLEKFWEWYFYKNPAKECQQSSGWVMESENRIIGHMGAVPQEFLIHSQKQIISFGCFFFVTAEFRGNIVGVRVAQAFLNAKELPMPGANSASEVTARIFKRFGCLEVPVNYHEYFLGMNWIGILKEKLPLKKAPYLLPAVILGGCVVQGAAKMRRWVKELKISFSTVEYKIEAAVDIGAEFDALWGELKNSYHFIAVRDRKFLKWRYASYPFKGNHLYTIKSENGKLLGYIAYNLRKKNNSNLKILEILDIFCDHKNETIVASAVQRIINDAKKHNIDVIIARFLPDAIGVVLEKFGFLIRKKAFNPVLIKNNAGYNDETLKDGSSWYLCSADGDALFIREGGF
jgi:hypothetical protein